MTPDTRVPEGREHWETTAEGWQYMSLGEDGETLVIRGHDIPDDQINNVVLTAEPAAANEDAGWDWADFKTRTWMREVLTAEEHECYGQSCRFCAHFEDARADGGWWSWATGAGEPADANKDKPGYFPVTLIELEG